MPVSNAIPTPTATPTPAEAPAKVVKSTPQVNFVEKEFEGGDAKGLKFVVPQWPSLEALIGYITRPEVKNEKGEVTEEAIDGKQVLLNMANQQASQRIAMKVKSQVLPRIPTGTDAEKAEYAKQVQVILAQKGGYVFNLEDAQAYKLGHREPSMAELQEELLNNIKSGKLTSPEEVGKAFLALTAKKRVRK